MADDVTFQTTVATPPSGTKIATDDVDGSHFQKVKLDVGGDGVSTPVDGTVPISGTVTVTEPVSVDDNGGSLTVDGTVAVTHVALTELAAAIDTELQVDVVGSLPAGTANIGDVDVASIAAGDNNIGNVDVVTLPSLPAGTNNIGDVDVLTLPSLPAGTNNIGDVDIVTMPNVTIGSALPAGTNAIGKLAANSGVDIGDVDVTSLPALPAGNNNIGDVDIASSVVLTTKLAAATATLTNVNDTNVSTTLLASNANRLGATIHNDSTAILYVKFGTTASTTSYTVKMVADAYYEVPFGYTGRIDGIWASDASGAARITELT